MTCRVDGCDTDAATRGLCRAHYHRLRRYGDPTHRPKRARAPLSERFWRHVLPAREGTSCWEWGGARQPLGYGCITVHADEGPWGKRQPRGAHQVSYLLAHGDLDLSLVIDHLCRNPSCVNPLHLDQVPHKVNVVRGVSPNARNARKTHCKRGHEFTDENIEWQHFPDGSLRGRKCITCRKMRERGEI